MFGHRKLYWLALAILIVALPACRLRWPLSPREGPAGGAPSSSTETALQTPAGQAVEQGGRTADPTATAPPLVTASYTPSPTATTPQPTATPQPTKAPRLVLTTPTPTATPSVRLVLTTPTPTLSSGPGESPGQPEGGPLPALWTEIDFGAGNDVLAAVEGTGQGEGAGGTYHVQELALDAQNGVVLALGACSPELTSTGGARRRCISTFDLDEDRVLPPGAVELPADVQSEGRLYVAGDVLYLHRRWAGVLYALDADTLTVRETVSDVYGLALDEADAATLGPPDGDAPYVVTSDGLSRLGTNAPVRPVARRYDNSPVDLVAAGERVYVVADGALQVFDAGLSLVTTVRQEDVRLYGLALDRENGRLYVGSYDGLYVLDLATNRLVKSPAEVGNVWGLVVDPDEGRLFALTDRSSDWFGGTDVVAVDTTSWETELLLSTLGGQLRDLVHDRDGDRVLVASADDHALIPIDVAPGEDSGEAGGAVGRRLPLGIEVVEVVVGDRLYVSDSAGWIHVLDRDTYATTPTKGAPQGRVYGGRHISLDPVHGRLYAGDERTPVVTVFDAASLAVERTLPQAGKPRANAYTGEVVIVNRRFYVFDGASGEPAGELRPGIGQPPEECPGCYYTVAREVAIDGQRGLTATITYTPWPGKAGPEESIDHDPISGRAYYGLITGGYVHYSSIATHPDLGHLEDRAPPVLHLEGLAGQIKLDPSARRLYVARGNVLFVLDSETLHRVGRVYTEGWTPVLAAVDGELGRLYSPRDSRLLVWTRTGGAPPPALPAEPWPLTNTVTSIQPSPDYARDGTLLAQIDGRLARTTDRGRTWQRLRGGLPLLGEYEPTVNAVFSPDYASDRRLFAGVYLRDTHGEGVYCSDDGGDTWRTCSDGLYDLRVHRVAPSPDYGWDRTLLAYARTPNGEALYRSANGGDSWSVVVRQTSWGTPPIPRPEELFYIEGQRPPQFACDYQGVCERSGDGGRTWTPFDTGAVSLEGLVATAVSPQYARDGTIYFMSESDLYRYQEEGQSWSVCTAPVFGDRDLGRRLTGLAVAATGEDTHDLFLGSAAGEFHRFVASELTWATVSSAKVPPAMTPLPTPCALPVDLRLQGIAQGGIQDLGCPVASGAETGAAFQPFERGSMLWREDLRLIYVLQEDGTWASYEDTWTPEQPEPNLVPPQGLYRPVRGFARVWVLDLEGPPSSIGWGMAPEQGYAMVVQPFARGLLTSGADGEVYALYDDGTWEEL